MVTTPLEVVFPIFSQIVSDGTGDKMQGPYIGEDVVHKYIRQVWQGPLRAASWFGSKSRFRMSEELLFANKSVKFPELTGKVLST